MKTLMKSAAAAAARRRSNHYFSPKDRTGGGGGGESKKLDRKIKIMKYLLKENSNIETTRVEQFHVLLRMASRGA